MKTILFFLQLFFLSLILAQNDGFIVFRATQKEAENFRNTLEYSVEPSLISGTKFTDYHSGIKKAYLFNGEFRMPITAGGENFISGKNNSFFHAIQFVPEVKIRIFDNDTKWQDKSKPVRTPSYYPKLYYFFTHKKYWNESRKYNFFLAYGILHHSNGQDGTEFTDYSDTVNLYNGSFSESLISHFLIGGKIKINQKNVENTSKLERKSRKNKIYKIQNIRNGYAHELIFKLGYEDHPLFFSDRKFHQTGVYGGNRVFTNLIWKKNHSFTSFFFENGTWNNKGLNAVKESYRISLVAEYITDLTFNSGGYNNLQKIPLTDYKKRLNICVSFYKRILDSKYPALFCQLAYYGSDNYNIYFQKSLIQARIGLAFSFFEFTKLSH